MGEPGSVAIPYGAGHVSVAPRPGWRLVAVRPRHADVATDADAEIRRAIEEPVAGPRLRDLAVAASERAARDRRPPRVVVAVTDATRDCPDDRFVPAILAELEAGGIGPGSVTLVVAVGIHRASTPDEKRAKLGEQVVARVRVIDHDAFDAAGLVDLGHVSGGVPAVVSRLAVEADLLLATGVVEPHQYAGWSGGGKTAAIGLAGEATIEATHGLTMLDDPRVRLTRLDDNPFAAAVLEIADRAGLAFVVNVVLDPEGRLVAAAAGPPSAVHGHLTGIASAAFTVPVAGRADVAVAGVPAEKAANLYQATRAATYLHYGPVPIVRPGGVYVVPAELPEGLGSGAGERRCAQALRGVAEHGPEWLLERLRREGALAGEQRAFIVASVLREARIVVAGPRDPALVRECGLDAAPTLDAALELAETLVRGPSGPARGTDRPVEILAVPDAIRTLPVVGMPSS